MEGDTRNRQHFFMLLQAHQAMVNITSDAAARKEKVLMFLWYMANQNSFREISDQFDVSQSSAHRIILEVLNTISTIFWPNACEKTSRAHASDNICGLSHVVDVMTDVTLGCRGH